MRMPPRPASAQTGNTLIGIVVGLLIAVVFAAGIALYINHTPAPFTSKDEPGAASAPKVDPSAPAALPGKPGDKPVGPNYDFYKILPGGDAASMPVSAPAQEPSAASKLYLQAGAFQKPADADNLKARLALMGMEAGVQQVDTPDKGTLHRVRVGPFNTDADADSARARLAQEGIETVVVHTKPAAR